MFSKKIRNFSIILAVVLIACFGLSKIILDNLFQKEAQLSKDTKWIAIGDSHITNAINPANYPWLVNRAHSGEKLLYNFEKIKLYIDNNPQVELVILGYWFGSLSYNMDWVLHGKDAKYRYETYLPLMIYNNTDVNYLNVPENKSMFLENYWGYKIGYPSPSVKLLIKNYFTFNQNLELKGGFLKARLKYNGKQLEKAEKEQKSTKMDSLSSVNLKQIVNYLKKKNVKLVLYNTPIHNDLLKKLTKAEVKKTDSIAMSFVDNKKVWYINHTKLITKNDFFNDVHHLNLDGANYITPLLMDTISKITKKNN